MNIIKKRKAKTSKRGLYIQDKELLNTSFQTGTNYKYVIDKNNRKILILPSEESTRNIVSKRKFKDTVKPVIDIRKQDIISLFNESDFLEVEIYEDKIIVEAFSEVNSNQDSLQKKRSVTKNKINKVTSITSILNLKRKGTVCLSKDSLQNAVGFDSYQQLEITDFIDLDQHSVSKKTVTNIQSALKNINIPLQVVSLFSGAGLFDLAFKEKGFDIIFALEKDEEIAKTYQANLGKIVTADIKHYDKSKLPLAPIVIGGSPCKGFSNSNRISNFLDNPNNLLVKEYIECVKHINPYVFVLENVPQILTAGEGRFFKEIESELPDYEITKGVITASDYGDPQDRKRAFIIGSRLGDKIDLPRPEKTTEFKKTVRDAFKGITSMLPNQLDISKPKPLTLERIKHVKPGGNIFDIPEEIRPKGKHSDMYKRLEWDKPAITIVNPRKAMLLHPEEDRIISIREACRLFSLPDSFTFRGSLSAMQESIANGIPLKMGKAIATKIKEAILQFNIRNRFELI